MWRWAGLQRTGFARVPPPPKSGRVPSSGSAVARPLPPRAAPSQVPSIGAASAPRVFSLQGRNPDSRSPAGARVPGLVSDAALHDLTRSSWGGRALLCSGRPLSFPSASSGTVRMACPSATCSRAQTRLLCWSPVPVPGTVGTPAC